MNRENHEKFTSYNYKIPLALRLLINKHSITNKHQYNITTLVGSNPSYTLFHHHNKPWACHSRIDNTPYHVLIELLSKVRPHASKYILVTMPMPMSISLFLFSLTQICWNGVYQPNNLEMQEIVLELLLLLQIV